MVIMGSQKSTTQGLKTPGFAQINERLDG